MAHVTALGADIFSAAGGERPAFPPYGHVMFGRVPVPVPPVHPILASHTDVHGGAAWGAPLWHSDGSGGHGGVGASRGNACTDNRWAAAGAGECA